MLLLTSHKEMSLPLSPEIRPPPRAHSVIPQRDHRGVLELPHGTPPTSVTLSGHRTETFLLNNWDTEKYGPRNSAADKQAGLVLPVASPPSCQDVCAWCHLTLVPVASGTLTTYRLVGASHGGWRRSLQMRTLGKTASQRSLVGRTR